MLHSMMLEMALMAVVLEKLERTMTLRKRDDFWEDAFDPFKVGFVCKAGRSAVKQLVWCVMRSRLTLKTSQVEQFVAMEEELKAESVGMGLVTCIPHTLPNSPLLSAGLKEAVGKLGEGVFVDRKVDYPDGALGGEQWMGESWSWGTYWSGSRTLLF